MFFRLPLPWTDGSFYFIFHIKYDYFFVPKATCRSLVSVLIIYVGNTQQDLLSVGWYLNKGRHINILTSSSRGKFITAQKQGEGGTGADQAMCQHFQIWPPFVPRLLSLLPSTHLWNHVMIIRWKPIKKSNKREYIIIETPRPDHFQLCVCDRKGRSDPTADWKRWKCLYLFMARKGCDHSWYCFLCPVYNYNVFLVARNSRSPFKRTSSCKYKSLEYVSGFSGEGSSRLWLLQTREIQEIQEIKVCCCYCGEMQKCSVS